MKSQQKHFRSRLGFLDLEDRTVPAISITFDYSYDTNNFFDSSVKKETLQAAASAIGSQLGDTLTAIIPGNGNSWTAEFFNPSDGSSAETQNLSVGQDQLIVYVGGRDFTSTELGEGGPGGFSASGSADWLSAVSSRGQGITQGADAVDTGPWGGSISFDDNPGQGGWYFSAAGGSIASNQYDFFTVASHELGHLLGLGTADSWNDKVSGGTFTGAAATQVYGAPVPLYSGEDHWAAGTQSSGLPALMDPIISAGEQTHFTALDLAGLKDIGWQVTVPSNSSGSGLGSVSTSADGGSSDDGSSSTDGSSSESDSNDPVAASAEVTDTMYAIAGDLGSDATVSVYNSDGSLRFTITAFQDFRGGLRLATGDINGDGIEDLIVAAEVGGQTHVAAFDGSTGGEIASFFAFDPRFSGGISIAAGNLLNNGHADIIVGALAGADPHIAVFDGITHQLVRSFDAFAASFRGGVNVAAGDIKGAGYADIVAAVASAGPPNIVAFDGETNAQFANFDAYSSGYLGGVYLAVGDVSGLLRNDIIVGPNVGPEHVEIFNGNNYSLISSFYADGSSLTTGGARVSADPLNGSIVASVLVATGPSSSPTVREFYGPTLLNGGQPEPSNVITGLTGDADGINVA